MNTNSILYSIKVWLTSVALAPLIYIIVDTFKSSGNQFPNFLNAGAAYLACVVIGGILSFFTWIIFILIIKGLITAFSVFRGIKILIAIIGALLTAATFSVIIPGSINVHNEFFFLMIANCMCIAGGSLYYTLTVDDKCIVIV